MYKLLPQPPSETWARKFFDMAQNVSVWSKDRSTKVGAIIFNPETYAMLSVGYNGFPRGVRDEAKDVTMADALRNKPSDVDWRDRIVTMKAAVEARHERPLKYKWTVHSELNAILNCARHGICTDHMAIALQWYPCMQPCAGAIVQAGIELVVCTAPDFNHPRYGEEFKLTKELFDEVGMKVMYLEAR